MILSRIAAKDRTTGTHPYWAWSRPLYWLLLLLPVISACGPKRPVIPNDVETLARRCYETLATPGRTPQLAPSQSMGDGTFLILWSMAEFSEEHGSCTVDGSGMVLLLTSNGDEQQQKQPTDETSTSD